MLSHQLALPRDRCGTGGAANLRCQAPPVVPGQPLPTGHRPHWDAALPGTRAAPDVRGFLVALGPPVPEGVLCMQESVPGAKPLAQPCPTAVLLRGTSPGLQSTLEPPRCFAPESRAVPAELLSLSLQTPLEPCGRKYVF